MKITLSGGHFGGVEVEWPEGQKQISMVDREGLKWVYDVEVHPKEPQAHFVGHKMEDGQ